MVYHHGTALLRVQYRCRNFDVDSTFFQLFGEVEADLRDRLFLLNFYSTWHISASLLHYATYVSDEGADCACEVNHAHTPITARLWSAMAVHVQGSRSALVVIVCVRT